MHMRAQTGQAVRCEPQRPTRCRQACCCALEYMTASAAALVPELPKPARRAEKIRSDTPRHGQPEGSGAVAHLRLLCPHDDGCPAGSAGTRRWPQAVRAPEALLACHAAGDCAGRCHSCGHGADAGARVQEVEVLASFSQYA